MCRFFDYIFYRSYIAYKKKNDPALFNSILYIASILMFLFIPIIGFIYELFRDYNGRVNKIIFVIYFVIILGCVIMRYSKKRKINDLMVEFMGNSANRIVPKWLIFTILPISMVLGIVSLILTIVYVVKPLNIEGFLYRLFFD